MRLDDDIDDDMGATSRSTIGDDGYQNGHPESHLLVEKAPGRTRMDDVGSLRGGELASAPGNVITPHPMMIPQPRSSDEPWHIRYRESNAAMWLGHFTFIAGAIFYLKCALVGLTWTTFARVEHVIPNEILEVDDDDAWDHWERKNLDKTTRHIVEDAREEWDYYSTLYCVLGGSFFVLCGIADLLYYCECVDIFMIFAGIAGVLSATSETTDMEGLWNFISCHMYLLEAYVMIRRQHHDIDEMGETYEGHNFFLLSRLFFFGGCLMDVSILYSLHFNAFILLASFGFRSKYFKSQIVTAYIEIFLQGSTFLDAYSDLGSCILWMACAIIDFCAEIYFLETNEEDEKKEEAYDEEDICNRPERGDDEEEKLERKSFINSVNRSSDRETVI